MRRIITKHVAGYKPTHNRDGRFLQCWRLWSDGIVERTNSRSQYRPISDIPPQPIVEAAKKAGITILGIV
jgi:hypothetical protein